MAQEEKNTADSALENTTVHFQKEQNKITIDDVAGALGFPRQQCHVQFPAKAESVKELGSVY